MGPVSNAWRSIIIAGEALWSSGMLFDMTGSRIVLMACLRSDKELFSAVNRLPALYNSADQASIIKSYAEQIQMKEPCVHSLCISPETRIKINNSENMRLAPSDAKYIKVQGKQAVRCAQQSMLMWPGLKLLGCVSRHRKTSRIQSCILFNIAMRKSKYWSCPQPSAMRKYKNLRC